MALLLTFWLFSPVSEIADVGLDSSNYASYSYFTGKEFQYGADVLPMAGPYGFVPYGFNYAGNLYWKRLPLELLTKFVLGILIVWFIRRSRDHVIMKGLWLLSLLLLAPVITDLPYTLAILLSGLCLVEYHVASGRRSLLIACALAVFLAFLTLFKGTQCMLAGATLGLLCLQAVLLGNYRRLPWILGSYLGALIGWLLIAGQNPLNFPRYFLGMLEISSGYNLAMGIDEPYSVFIVGVTALIALLLLTFSTLIGRWRQPTILAGALFIAGFSFIAWKHGFVRADGHVTIYFNYVCIAVPTVLLFTRSLDAPNTRFRQIWLYGLAVFTFGIGLWGDGTTPALRWEGMRTLFQDRLALNIHQLTSPIQAKAELESELEINRQFYRLRRLQEAVGRNSIDFFGNEQGFLLLNRLNYRPRPVGGGTFSVFTPTLRDINTQWMEQAENRPEYYLVNVAAIDDRLTSQEDAGTLHALLSHYHPIETILGLPLFQLNQEASALSQLTSLGSQPLDWDQPIKVPTIADDQILFVTFSIPPSLLGRIRTFFYKPPSVFIDMRGSGIEYPTDRKIIPSMVAESFPLSPLIENTSDLLSLYRQANGKRVHQFTLKSTHHYAFDQGRMQVEFFTAPRPTIAPPPIVSSRHSAISEIEPIDIDAPLAPVFRFDNYVAQVLVPPGKMDFPLSQENNAIQFSFGMLKETYVKNTDGTTVYVKLKRPGQPPQKLFQRRLQPLKTVKDHGVQTAVVSFPPFPSGSKVVLSTDRGPDNDGAWDLVYFTRIKLLKGPYMRDQFPEFSRVPNHVEAGTNGSISDGKRKIYLLNAPGRLIFNLRPEDRKITVTWGLLPGAYQNGGHSDGVEFALILRSADGSEQTLLSHYCNPVRNPEDSGDQTYSVSLPLFTTGSQLILASLPGPKGDASWDWAYIQSLRIE